MEIRKNPFTQEYTLVSPHRLRRPWQPADFCPFCPGAPEAGHGWKIMLLQNKYPVVTKTPPRPRVEELYEAAEAYGDSYVLIETPEHQVEDMADLPAAHLIEVIKVVVKLQKEAEKDPKARYLLFFRNKGKEIGVSLTHPHSQIYILPVVPPRVATEIENSERWHRGHGGCLHCQIVERERTRVVWEGAYWKSFVPYYARWPHEIHIYPKNHRSSIIELTEEETAELAEALQKTLCTLKYATERPMPYVLVLHQAPLRSILPYYHLHFEIYGMYRPDGKLKHAAGAELGGGLYTLDTTPEETADRLRKAAEKCSTTSS